MNTAAKYDIERPLPLERSAIGCGVAVNRIRLLARTATTGQATEQVERNENGKINQTQTEG